MGKKMSSYQSVVHRTGQRPFLTPLLGALGILCSVLLGGCLPSGEQDVNTELFKDKTEMAAKSTSLKHGMSKKQTLEALGVPEDRFERMSLQDIQLSLYGNSVVQGSPEQLEQFRRRIQAYDGYALPYREIKSSSSLGFGKMKVEKTGHDLRLVLIFERDRLVRSALEGTHHVNQAEDRYMWESLISKGIGSAF